MKAILMFDMPTECVKCNQFAFECCHAMKREIERENIVQCKRPSWCPVKPIPNRIDWLENGYNAEWILFSTGWNACLDEILGETE